MTPVVQADAHDLAHPGHRWTDSVAFDAGDGQVPSVGCIEQRRHPVTAEELRVDVVGERTRIEPAAVEMDDGALATG
jgi:hypothetical protein